MHPIKHLLTITKHRHTVMRLCFKCGLIYQGLTHDLSKLSFLEFWCGAKYFLGYKSPHLAERKAKGYSDAWMHHKGRNKHHVEYWVDFDMTTRMYQPVEVPNKYVAESICDRIAAAKIYNKKNFVPKQALDYFYHEGEHLPMSDNTRARLEYLLKYYCKYGEKALCKFMRKNMRNKLTTIKMEEI